jgi:hypothetical protein
MVYTVTSRLRGGQLSAIGRIWGNLLRVVGFLVIVTGVVGLASLVLTVARANGAGNVGGPALPSGIPVGVIYGRPPLPVLGPARRGATRAVSPVHRAGR